MNFPMKKRMRLLQNCTIAICCCIGFFYSAKAQDIDAAINSYASMYSPERIYIHYDKAGYTAGETVWFKAYMMNEIIPADESKTLYIDWIDDKGTLLSHAVSPLVEAVTNGQFEIPADYKGRSLSVRAYTKWMLNFDSAFLYHKDIPVFTKDRTAGDAKNKIVPTIRFFPEGGDIISGLTNKIAFKANDQWGKPVKVTGVIQNSKGEKIDSLVSLHDGMGYFFLFPVPGETYTAKWSVRTPSEKDEKSISHTTPLPTVKPTGVSLQVTISGTKRIFSIAAAPEIVKAAGTLHVVGTLNQYPAFKVSKSITEGFARGIIPTENLPSGILTITVFDAQWNPLAERITYINNDEYRFNAEMTVEHWGLNKRARNEILLTVPDSLLGSFAVSVTDAGIETDSSENIISHFLLTSDIKGRVHNPSYYFSANNDTINQQLDLVMLTHGWRRFKWEDIVKGKLPKITYPKDTAYLALSGKVYGATPTALRSNANIILIVNQKKSGDGNKMLMLPVNPDGTFIDPSFFLLILRIFTISYPKDWLMRQ